MRALTHCGNRAAWAIWGPSDGEAYLEILTWVCTVSAVEGKTKPPNAHSLTPLLLLCLLCLCFLSFALNEVAALFLCLPQATLHYTLRVREFPVQPHVLIVFLQKNKKKRWAGLPSALSPTFSSLLRPTFVIEGRRLDVLLWAKTQASSCIKTLGTVLFSQTQFRNFLRPSKSLSVVVWWIFTHSSWKSLPALWDSWVVMRASALLKSFLRCLMMFCLGELRRGGGGWGG